MDEESHENETHSIEFHSDESASESGPDQRSELEELFDDINRDNVRDIESRLRGVRGFPRCENEIGNVLHQLVDFVHKNELVRTHQVGKFGGFLNEVFKYDDLGTPLLEETNSDGYTPILSAVSVNKVRLIELLCDVATKNNIPLAKAISIKSHKSHNNCIHQAIKSRLVYVALSRLIENSDSDGLKVGDIDGNTPLHLAMKNENFYKGSSSSDVSKRPDKVIFQQMSLVDSLVNKCPQALKCRNLGKAKDEKRGQSPFQFLLENRNIYQDTVRLNTQKTEMKKDVTKAADAKAQIARNASVRFEDRREHPAQPLRGEIRVERRQEAAPAYRQAGVRMEPKGLEVTNRPMKTLQRSGTMHEEERSPSAAENYDRSQIKKESNTKVARDSEKSRKSGKSKSSKTQKSKDVTLSPEDINAIYFDIEEYLWNYVLRNFTVDEASKIAYGPTPNNELDFNLLGIKRYLDFPAIKKKHGSFLTFNRILQYVALPQLLSNVRLQPNTEEKTKLKNDPNKSASPTQYLEVFRWLRKTKGVQRILQIHIDDDLEHPHSDQVIEETIKDFGVELWNWRKFDISSETIFSAAPNTREAILYTTGNKAVLQGWSDEQGLRKLKELEKVLLRFKGSNDRGQPVDEDEIKKDVDYFKKRLEALLDQDRRVDTVGRPAVSKLIASYEDETLIDREMFIRELEKLPERTNRNAIDKILSTYNDTAKINRKALVHNLLALPTDTTRPQTQKQLQVNYSILPFSKSPSLTSKGERSVERRTHKWMSCVDTCATWIANTIDEESSTFIKVAIIDDGVDASHEGLRYIKTGVTYRPGNKDRPTASSYYSSTTGHGTLMATLIQSVCPFVEFYIAKLDDSGDKFTPESAAKAIAWAVSMNVDVISMSWIINKDDLKSTQAVQDDLDFALTSASNKGILMFCAAKDEGIDNSNRQTYPAAGIPGKIFKIGAAAQTGVNSAMVNRASVDFLFPGTELRESFPKLAYPTEMSVVDGSSPATALASGLAALLLYFLSKDTRGRWNIPKSRRYEGIDALLKSAANVDGKYVQVWELFGSLEKEAQSTVGRLDVLQTFLDTLITKATI